MTAAECLVQRTSPRAPRQDRTAVVDVPLDEVGGLLQTNAQHATRHAQIDLNGRTLADLAAEARQHLVESALAYTRQYRDVPDPRNGLTDQPLFLAGHQPQLFHPGVWFKNFTLQYLANRHGGAAVNLVIDSDMVKEHAVRVPGGSREAPTVQTIEYDRALESEWEASMPYEQRGVVDADLFHSFADRAAEWLAPLVPNPMVREFWPLAVERLKATGNLGQALSQSRHIWEARWGGCTLELPQSAVCDSEPFHWFVAHLLAHLPRFWQIYNAALVEYRQQNRLRSATHPVPNLIEDDGWLEAPLWVWSDRDPRRRPLYARAVSGPGGPQVQITDRHGWQVALPLSADGDAFRAAGALAGLSDGGIKIRTRALLTTLWARLSLGDLFLHGIGGAKYDQLTDRLICRFYGVQPPRYLTVSATLLLPVRQEDVREEDLRRLDREEREMLYHPERFLAEVEAHLSDQQRQQAQELVQAKEACIAEVPAPGQGRMRHRAITAINERLQPFLEVPRRQRAQLREQLVERLRQKSVLSSREYAFCLYPADTLHDFLLAILGRLS